MRKQGNKFFVIRISKAVMEHLNSNKRGNESMDRLLRRLIGIPNRKGIAEYELLWALPSNLYSDLGTAKGEAIKKKVMMQVSKSETPVSVMVR